jgi:DNA-binding NtrC family response regulator
MPDGRRGSGEVAGTVAVGTVLVIDDDPSCLESLAMVLECHGFHVLTARDGRDGMRVFRANCPAVVVTDIIMPEQDGIGVMLQMRHERPGVKIVVISGDANFDSWDCLLAARHLGADAMFRKTIDTGALIKTLHRLLH